MPQQQDALTNEKAQAASVFKEIWFKAKDHAEYLKQKADFKEKYYLAKKNTKTFLVKK